MGAKVKGQGHKVTHDENVQSAENVVDATISKWHDIFFPTICVLRFLCHFQSDLSHIWPVDR